MSNKQKSTALYSHPFSKAYWRDAAAELKDTHILVFAALMIALRLVMKQISIPITPVLRINTAYFVNALGAMVYGPVVAAICAVITTVWRWERALALLLVFGALSIAIGVWILVKLPSSATRPLLEVTRCINEIANHNYDTELHLTGSREMEQLSSNFNRMARRLRDYARRHSTSSAMAW